MMTMTTKISFIMKSTNELKLFRLIYYSQSAPHVSSDVFAHHQEHLTVFTASGNIHQCRCQLAATLVNIAPDDGRKHRPKHVELTRNNKLTYIVASRCLIL
jgi:hypothetical protein